MIVHSNWNLVWDLSEPYAHVQIDESQTVGGHECTPRFWCYELGIKSHLDDALAGGQRKSHQAGPIDRHDLVSNVQSARPLRRPSMHHVRDDDGGQDGAPSTLHNDHTQNLTFTFLYEHLSDSRATNQNQESKEVSQSVSQSLLIQ